MSDGCERQLRQGVKSPPNYRGSLFTNRNRKTHPSRRSSELGRQQAGKAAFLPDSIPTEQRSCPAAAAPGSPWFYVPLSSANRFLALQPEGMGVPSYFQQGARGLGPPPTRSPSQIHSGPVGCRKSFPAPKPAGGARGRPAVQPQAPRRGQETPNEATLRQDISCNSPDHQSLLPPSQGTGEESDSKESSQGQGIPINRNKDGVIEGAVGQNSFSRQHSAEKPTPTLLAARSRGSLRAAQPSQAKELPMQFLSRAKKTQSHCQIALSMDFPMKGLSKSELNNSGETSDSSKT